MARADAGVELRRGVRRLGGGRRRLDRSRCGLRRRSFDRLALDRRGSGLGGIGGGGELLLGRRSSLGAVALAEDAALEQRVERLGRHEHELHLGADLLADRGESLLTRIGDGDDRPTRLDPERHGAHLPRVLRLEERVRLGVDRQLVPGTELELPLIGKCLRLRVLCRLGGARWDGGGGG